MTNAIPERVLLNFNGGFVLNADDSRSTLPTHRGGWGGVWYVPAVRLAEMEVERDALTRDLRNAKQHRVLLEAALPTPLSRAEAEAMVEAHRKASAMAVNLKCTWDEDANERRAALASAEAALLAALTQGM